MSSSSQAARGSPSRGWPTLPGLISQRPSRRRGSVPAPACAPWTSPRSASREEERDVGVADEADPRRLAPACTRPPGRARARTPRPDRAARRGRATTSCDVSAGERPRRKSSVPSEEFSLVHSTAAAAAARRSRCRARRSPRGRGCRPGRASSARPPASAQSSGLGAVADDVAEAPDLLRLGLSMSARTASSAGRLAWMSLKIAIRMRPGPPMPAGSGRGEQRAYRTNMRRMTPTLALGAPDRRDGRGRFPGRRGGRPAAAAPRRARSSRSPVAASDYFDAAQIERAEDFRDGQRLLGLGGLAVSGAVARRALARPAAGGAARASSGSAAGPSSARPPPGAGALGRSSPWSACRWPRSPTSAPSTSASRPRSFAAWLGDAGKAARDRRRPRPAPAPRSCSRSFAACRASGGPGGAAAWSPTRSSRRRSRRSCSRRSSTTSRSSSPGRRARPCVELADRAGVEVGEVYEVDASRRSTALNAYVSGLGPTKRVVVYDNLLAPGRAAGAALGARPRARPRAQRRHLARHRLPRDRRAARAARRQARRHGARPPRRRRSRARRRPCRPTALAIGARLARRRRRRNAALARRRGGSRRLRAAR